MNLKNFSNSYYNGHRPLVIPSPEQCHLAEGKFSNIAKRSNVKACTVLKSVGAAVDVSSLSGTNRERRTVDALLEYLPHLRHLYR